MPVVAIVLLLTTFGLIEVIFPCLIICGDRIELESLLYLYSLPLSFLFLLARQLLLSNSYSTRESSSREDLDLAFFFFDSASVVVNLVMLELDLVLWIHLPLFSISRLAGGASRAVQRPRRICVVAVGVGFGAPRHPSPHLHWRPHQWGSLAWDCVLASCEVVLLFTRGAVLVVTDHREVALIYSFFRGRKA